MASTGILPPPLFLATPGTPDVPTTRELSQQRPEPFIPGVGEMRFKLDRQVAKKKKRASQRLINPIITNEVNQVLLSNQFKLSGL
ncbi:hypothetical protein MRX96_000221 [Rhipicephalus microplus]